MSAKTQPTKADRIAPDPLDDFEAEFDAPKKVTIGNVTYHNDLEQGSEQWLQARCGLITASEMKLLITPTLKVADSEKTRVHLYELASQRISKYVEPHYVGDDMLRGMADEVDARMCYAANCAPVKDVGFITNSKWGFTLGYSPDGLVGVDGLLECKGRRQKFQVQTIVENVWKDLCASIPADYVMQCQTGMAVSERKWLDFISYSGGLPMVVIRVWPDPVITEALLTAADEAETKMRAIIADYHGALQSQARLFPTQRRIIQEMFQ